MKTKSYLLKFSEELHKEIKTAAVERDMSMQDYIVQAIYEKVTANEKQIDRKAV